jgi:hypothetical protein
MLPKISAFQYQHFIVGYQHQPVLEENELELGIRNQIIESMNGKSIVCDNIRNTLKQLGSPVVPALIDLVGDPSLMNEDSHGEGFIPILSAKILAENGELSSIKPMLQVLMKIDPLTETYDEIESSVVELLKHNIEPAFELFFATNNTEDKIRISNLFMSMKSKDPRVFDVLVDSLRSGYEIAAPYLVDFGDRRAIPILSEQLDNFTLSDSCFENMMVVELASALEEFGVELSPQQSSKLHSARSISN